MKNGGPRSAGFTIVETMIVLAVTGALFVAIAATLSGRQRANQFQQAINDAQSQIQQVINQVSAGFYPNLGNFSCKQVGGVIKFASTSTAQGMNKDCIFLGKAIQFQVCPSGSAPCTTDPEEFRVFTVAGLREGVKADPAAPFTEVAPTVIAPTTTDAGIPDESTTGHLLYGLTTAWIRSPAIPGNSYSRGAVAFMMEPASLDDTSGNFDFNSGAQPVDLVSGYGTSLGQKSTKIADDLNSELKNTGKAGAPLLNPNGGVQICFASGGTNQSGLVTIGNNGRALSVSLDMKNGKNCGADG